MDDTRPIPDRWLPCPLKVASMPQAGFLPFKVPLDAKYRLQVPEQNTWDLDLLLSGCRNLGMIINLTKTDRYYDASVLSTRNILWRQIMCGGHEEPPTVEQADLFVKICQQFWAQYPDRVIGVHCTHGYNRTGFMIACFLVEHEQVSIEIALRMFAASRPPGIYKDSYIVELCKRFDGEPDGFIPVDIPEWSRTDAGLCSQ